MTKTIVRERTFAERSDLDTPPVIRGVRAEKCIFDVVHYGQKSVSPSPRRRIEDIEAIMCKSKGPCYVRNTILDEVFVDSWDGSTVWMEGCLLRHVTVIGKCGSFVLQREWGFTPDGKLFDPAPSAEELAHYQDLDWAIDISRAEFKGLELRSVPARFVRRNPETQMVAKLERVRETQLFWKKHIYADEVWPIVFHNMLEDNIPDRVLVAPVRGKRYAAEIKAMNMLRKKGVLEPD